MPKFPEPPTARTLAKRAPPEIRMVRAGTPLWRVYFRGGPHPTAWNQFRHFGPTSGRFDHHLEPPRPQRRGILYAAPHGPTCLAEVFQEQRVMDRHRRVPWLVEFEISQDLVLLDLSGRWVARAGASAAISSGPRPRARRWARAIYGAFREVQGLVYPSSMDPNHVAVALFERARRALPDHPLTHRSLSDPLLYPALCYVAAEFRYELV